jgi:hypothetical protein
MGASDDLEIYHDGSNSYVKDAGTGELRLEADAGGVRIQRASGHTGLFYNVGGQVELYYDNTKRFETTSDGCETTGKHLITGTTNGELNIKAGSSSGNDIISFENSGGTQRGNITYDTDNNFLFFNVSQSERTRIDQNGTLSHGTTTDNPGDANTNTGFAVLANGKYFFSCASDGGHINRNNAGYVLHSRFEGAHKGGVYVNSTNTSFQTSSDYRLKENIVNLDGAITRIKELAPRRFNFINEPGTTVDGFIAHEAVTVVPEAVTGTKDEVDSNGDPVYQGIDNGKLVPLLTAALQEAIAKIETLEAAVTALQGS